jgi:integrase
VTRPRELRKPTITEEAPREPLTDVEQADVWLWAKNLSVKKRAKRMTAFLALGLGCGLTGGELARATRDDVTIDDDGAVHVTVVSAKSTRVVTCLAQWEVRVADIVRDIAPGHMLTAPWRTDPGSGTLNESVRRAMAKRPPMVFNATRLRNTWLCWHLAHGTPLKELMQASDMKEANHLHNLLPLLPETDRDRTARLLRGNPPRQPIVVPVPETNISVTVSFNAQDHS